MSKSIKKQEESELQKDKSDNAKSIAIAEYNKTELDKLIAEMEAISQVRVSMLPTSIHHHHHHSHNLKMIWNFGMFQEIVATDWKKELLGIDDPDAI